MPFDFELSFTGLCLFVLQGKDKRKPDKLTALLVSSNGHNHAEPAHQAHGSESHMHKTNGSSHASKGHEHKHASQGNSSEDRHPRSP